MGLGNEFVLCAVAGSCVGVAGGEKEGELIVSFKSGAIQVYNVRMFPGVPPSPHGDRVMVG